MATGKGSNIEMVPISMQRQTIWHLQKMKDEGKKISMVGTAYMDPIFTMLCEKAGVNLVRYTAPGETSAHRANNIAWWTRAIRKMAPNICLNAVMQTQQYGDKYTAVKEASILMADGADSVLPMGVTNDVLKAMSDNNIPVFGHVGCLSGWQTGRFGGYRRVGKTAEDAMNVFRQAYEYQENGMVGMTIEMAPRELTDMVAKKLRIPVIQVAAGGVADGSELVIFDLLGFLPPEALAKHSKAYASFLGESIKAFTTFDAEVKNEVYPAQEHGWSMSEAELDKFMNLVEQKY
ncbi:MAG: 3-methyl-2-oxobutanoate hydroxymethyltransferase [Clostridiales bacterium]|jgi:3-methyl-2-oxobutanoate hydroxymethyltransferase|nr:3-methyl-2-oxobutanoate hydroxymethyltransferase [Clostridiales bacterium]MDN5297516.1 3-methyl-2-oxobutanoate hydroxymethyltransferase [Clostridiales bacterium]